MPYSSISITAPVFSEEGSVVQMSTEVTNITATSRLFRLELFAVKDIYEVPTPEEKIGSLTVNIAGGQAQVVSGTFIMPAWDAIIIVMVYLFINVWDFDNYATHTVSWIAPPGTISGEITKTEIEVDSHQTSPPVSGVAVGDDFLLHVWGKNTSTESVKMGLRYVITSPTGATIERRIDEAWPYTGSGQTHKFVEGPAGLTGRFDVDEPGTWLLQLYLYGDDNLVDMLDVEMFTATGEPPEDPDIIAGEIISVEMEIATGFMGGSRELLSLPANVQVGTNFWLRVIGLNETSESLRLGIRYVITRPDGSTISDETMEMWPYTGGNDQHEFYEPQTSLNINQSGEWNLKVELLGGSEKQVLDTWEGVMVQATTEEPEPEPNGAPSGFTLVKDKVYPLASTYYGNAERSTVTFSVIAPSFLISDESVEEMVIAFEDKFAEEDAHMLELKLYEKSGLVQTDYSATIVTTLPTTTGQVEPTILGISTTIFTIIVIAVCLLVGLIIILVVRKDISQFLFGTPPSNGEPGTPGMVGLIGNMVVVMMMVMMMEMMGPMMAPEGAPPQPKPVTEAAVRAAKGVGKAAVKAAPYVGKAVKKVTEYYQER